MIIAGIDPGTARLGWAIVITQKTQVTARSYGCIQTEPKHAADGRLLHIYKKLSEIFKSHKPDVAVIEDLYFATNAKTAISVGQARGVALLTAALAKIPVVSYSPLTVKRTICGTGTADKKQMQFMVTKLLKLKEIPQPDDAADALAIALTHAYSYKMKEATT